MSGQGPNRTSFVRGASGNPGGRPATAEVSALARRYTADWLRGLVDVVRLPVTVKSAPSIVSAARELREVGYPGLTKAPTDAGTPALHLHLLAVTQQAQATLQGLPQGGAEVIEGWFPGEDEPPLDDAMVPRPDPRLPHEALPLWDAAQDTGHEAQQAGEGEGESRPD